MAIEKAKNHLKTFNLENKVLEFDKSSATVELAALAVGCIPGRIAKTLSFEKNEGCLLIVTAGDVKIDNKKFKNKFGLKAKMISADKVLQFTGHEIGGVCPFGVPEKTEVYCDISMQRFDTVFPACGSNNSAIELTCDELGKVAKSIEWVDVCKGWE
ncbi:MAG: YbaK/EbsC family protein [Eubacteriaceae bacterium]